MDGLVLNKQTNCKRKAKVEGKNGTSKRLRVKCSLSHSHASIIHSKPNETHERALRFGPAASSRS